MNIKAMTLTVATALCSFGCQQIFTTSLGASLARSSPVISANITAAEAGALLEDAMANGDQAMAAALLPALSAAAALETPGTEAYNAAVSIAADAAVLSTGIESLVTTAATSLLAITSDGSTPTSEQIAAVVAALIVDASPEAIAAMALLSTVPDATVNPDTCVIAGIAVLGDAIAAQGLTIDQVATASPEALAAIQADPNYAIAQALLEQGAAAAAAQGSTEGLAALIGALIPEMP